ncbi:MAG: PilZ domain-containing protein [Chromatiales bacterium]|jgi:hypothetical protein
MEQRIANKRRHPRTDCRFPVSIEQECSFFSQSHCHTSNIGMKGLYIPNAPKMSAGATCTVVLHDHQEEILRLTARVSHTDGSGIGLTFEGQHLEHCLKLKHIVKPRWNGESLLEGLLLTARYAHPTDLKDCLALTSLLASKPPELYGQPHTECSVY